MFIRKVLLESVCGQERIIFEAIRQCVGKEMPWGGGHPEAILAKLLWLQAMGLLSANEAAHLLSEESELLLASLPPLARSS